MLALPRGGVPVGYEVARCLGAPLDVYLVRKLGVPGQEELAFGAIAWDGTRVLNPEVLQIHGLEEWVIEEVAKREREELQRRAQLYRGRRPMPVTQGRTVILTDDGLATGATMKAAVEALRETEPSRIIVAVPVAPRETVEEFKRIVDQVVCPAMPDPFNGVGMWYEDFSQTTDDEVGALLKKAT